MKGKKSQYILLSLALIVWGLIIYKVIVYLNDDGGDTGPVAENNAPRQNQNLKDTFRLLGNYRDPFLSGASIPVKTSTATSKNEIRKEKQIFPLKTEPVVTQKWPEIVYGGIIENRINKRAVVILRINGKERLMSKGDVFDGVSLLKISKDSVHVAYNSQKKIIVK